MKRDEFEWRFRLKDAISKPSFWFEFLSILPPYLLHPAHGIRHIVDPISLLDPETIWQHIVGLGALSVLK